MFEMVFYNSIGSVVFGGGKSNSAWRVIEAEGLGLSGKSYKSCTYDNYPGQETVNVHTNARTITLKGDFFMQSDYLDTYREALSVLDKKGVFEIRNAGTALRINA